MARDPLLKSHDRVFTRKKRAYGPVSVLLALSTAVVLALLWASWIGWVFPDGWLMLVGGLLLSILVPLTLARRLHVSAPRLTAALNLGLIGLMLTALGGPMNRSLERFGIEPFRAVARALDPSVAGHPVVQFGEGTVSLLRSFTLWGGEAETPPEPRARDQGQPVMPQARLERGGTLAVAGAAAGHMAEEIALQAAIETSGEAALEGASILSGRRVQTVEVPIPKGARTVTVGAMVDGSVPAEFSFDTGAEITAITPSLARRLGHDPEKLLERRKFLTAGGPVEDAVVRLRSVAIDGAAVEDIDAMVCSHCSRNLLGRNFQRHFRVEIDNHDGVLRLHRR